MISAPDTPSTAGRVVNVRQHPTLPSRRPKIKYSSQSARAVERRPEDTRDLLRELRIYGRRRQLPHVIREMKVGVVDPARR
jgi:hypothetical protein